jgi:pimeloyl-ACP methyl ester carboxylesterase
MDILITLLWVAVFTVIALALFTWFVASRISKGFVVKGDWMLMEGERIHYRTMGEGPAIVIVHGLGGQTRNFDYLPLADLAKRWRLFLIDRPGSGHSPRTDDARAAIPAQAQLVIAFIRQMQFQQPPLLVGHSLGGAIALSVALQEPDCIAGIGLIAPLTHFNRTVPAPFRALAIETPWLRRLFAHTLAAPLAILNTKAALRALFGPDEAPADFATRGGGLMSLRPTAFYGASTDMNAIAHDLPQQQERYGEIRVPVHVLYGDGDRILDWHAQSEALRDKVPGAQLKVIPGGHMLPVTQPAATAAWLEETARAVRVDL